ncbi:hypothetical protein GQF61_07750 [Sphingobacterium sp. DK4209]|uniref:hypothetical protein n=1 Tax=Sphingobacterium zhuxiongii TaxID=2662364 RepID=UPI0012968830|nr:MULTISPECIES: hypothetical protein [unclassified Sphingobacterium]MVZ65749.1 hypothetical protein [Sphingobacterium sp. DK4209]
MENNVKKVYEAPIFQVFIVELEQGIAAASGNSSESLSDWDSGTGGGSNGDF